MPAPSIIGNFHEDELRAELHALGADPDIVEHTITATTRFIDRLLAKTVKQTCDTIALTLTADQLYALHILLSAAYHAPVTGSVLGALLRDWRDLLDPLHHHVLALVQDPEPNPTSHRTIQ